MAKEYLISEPLRVRLPLDQPDEDGVFPLESEVEAVVPLLRIVCAKPQGTVFVIAGRAVSLVCPCRADPKRGTRLLDEPKGGGCAARLVFSCQNEPNQWITIEYVGVKIDPSARNVQYALEVEFNPTTILTGNNVFPVVIANPATGELYDSPSSSWGYLAIIHRLGFDFLSELNEQVFPGSKSLSSETRSSIVRGDFRIVRAQWCVYFDTPKVSLFLQLCAVLFGHTIASKNGIVQLATHLGFRFDIYTDPKTNLVTGVMLRKMRGDEVIYSLVFYNKAKKIAKMRQGKTLSDIETDTVRNAVRFDMTAHPEGLAQILADARRHLRKLRADDPEVLSPQVPDEFLDEEPAPTAWWLQRAIFVLSHRIIPGQIKRKSFARWLVPKMLHDVLRLDSIATFSSKGFHKLGHLNDPVAAGWSSIQNFDPDTWAGQLATLSGCRKSTIYNRRKQWLEEYHIDIALPFAFYRDLLVFGPQSLTATEIGRLSTRRSNARTPGRHFA